MYKGSKEWAVSFLLITCIFSQLIVIAYAWEIDKTASVTSVIDGDSFSITGDEVRLADVSAPEWDEPGGSAATSALYGLISGKTVYLDTDQQSGRGPYGRLIAVVYVKTSSTQYINVNKALLNQGVVSRTDYTNNEFNPSTWTLYVNISSSEGQGSRLGIYLIIGIGILVLIFLVRPKKRKKRDYRSQGLKNRKRASSWDPLTFTDKATRERIRVGSWMSEYVGKERKVSFRPRTPIKNRDSGIWSWLNKEMKKYGRIKLVKNGGIDLFIPRNVKYGDLLGQIGWAYYTLLSEDKNLH